MKLLAYGFISEMIWVLSLFLIPWRSSVEYFLALLGIAFAVYFFVVRFVLSREVSLKSAFWIIGAGLIFRGTAFFAPPTLSDDIYRYLWDGRVQVAGLNPYKYPPDAPELAHLKTPEWDGINHKHIRTIYPPLSQIIFATGALVYPTINTQKLIFVGFDVLTSVLLLFLLKRKNLPLGRVLIYSWHPLVIIEFASSGHLDSLAMSMMVAGFLFLEGRRVQMSGAAWGLGFLAKLGTGLMLPWMILNREGRRLLLPFIATIGLGYACYALSPLGEWKNFLSSPAIYAKSWAFNAGLFDLLLKLPFLSPSLWRITAGIVVVGVAGWMALKTDISPLAQMGILFATVLSLSPVVYPWYATWLVPFLCFFPLRAGFAFTGLVGLSYLVLPRFDGGLGWTLPPWVRIVEYGVPAGLLVWETRKRK
jgi:alpha-1,6-mannosyltransferase